MGSEIIYPIGWALLWAFYTALCLGVVYALAAIALRKFGSNRWLVFLLRAIWLGLALLLFFPTGLYAMFAPLMLVGVIVMGSSILEKLVMVPLILAVGGALFILWKGVIFLLRHLEKHMQPRAPVSGET